MDWTGRADYEVESVGLAKGSHNGEIVYCFYQSRFAFETGSRTIEIYVLEERPQSIDNRNDEKYQVVSKTYKIEDGIHIGVALGQIGLFDGTPLTFEFEGKNWQRRDGWAFLQRRFLRQRANNLEKWAEKTVKRLHWGTIYDLRAKDKIGRSNYTEALRLIYSAAV